MLGGFSWAKHVKTLLAWGFMKKVNLMILWGNFDVQGKNKHS